MIRKYMGILNLFTSFQNPYDSFASSPKMVSLLKTPTALEKSFPTSYENQGLTYIRVVSPTVFTTKYPRGIPNPNGYFGGLRGTGVECKNLGWF